MTEQSFNLAKASIAGSPSNLRSNQDVVYVDVGSRKIDSLITRDGIPIGQHTIDPEILKRIIVDRPVVAFRIVNQSVPAGTPVPQGTTIDVLMARPGNLPLGVVTGVHLDLREQTVEQNFARFINPATRRVVARAAEGPLSGEDEQTIKRIFAQNQVEVTEEPGKDVDAALETLRMLTTFGGS